MPDTETIANILQIEDNPNDAKLCIRALKKHNLANCLEWVKDGVEALDFIFSANAYTKRSTSTGRKGVPLDLRLPKLDGNDVLHKLKGNERTRIIPVVLMTSSKEESNDVASYRLGVNSFVNKPIEFDKFAQTVEQLSLHGHLVNRPPPRAAGA